jgi:hypothetical protein
MAKKLINKNAKWDLFIYLFSGTKVILMITYDERKTRKVKFNKSKVRVIY